MDDWTKIGLQIGNLVIALVFLGLFVARWIKIKDQSQTSRFLHLYPYYRGIFVLVFVAFNIGQIIAFFVISKEGISSQHYYELYFILGTFLNSVILVFELFLMRQEILKERPYSPIHRFYWIYLPIITGIRCIGQIINTQQSQLLRIWQSTLSALIFVDSLLLFIYSLFLKKQQIAQYEERQLFQFDNPVEHLKNSLAMQEMRKSNTKPILSVEIQMKSPQELEMLVHSSEGFQSSKSILLKELADFQVKTKKFKMLHNIDFNSSNISLNDIQAFFDELLAKQSHYETFVLEFLGLKTNQIRHFQSMVRKQSTISEQTPDDPNCFYYHVFIERIIQIRSHFEFLVRFKSTTGNLSKQIQKRYSEFQQLDKKLKMLDVRGMASTFRLKMPQLPQKYFVHLDEQNVEERRLGLQQYLRRITNDITLIKKFRESREIIFDFLQIPRDQNIPQGPFQFPSGLSFRSDSINKVVFKDNEPATYYTFTILQNGSKIGTICKRYSQFEQLHRQIKRWLYNSQLQLKTLVLPPKKIKSLTQKQKQSRHRQFTMYLNILGQDLHGVEECYEWRVFLSLTGEPDDPRSKSVVEVNQETLRRSSVDSARLSLLIDTLGDNTLRNF